MAHILLVDDDKDILLVVSKLLEKQGHTVISCIDPLDAMDHWNSEHFDLVITDANMPHINGFDLTKTISQNARGLGTAVALLTARREKEDVKRGIESGADDYIIKPIDPAILMSKVELLIAKNADKKVEIQFAESPIRMNADWRVATEITHISEQGLTLLSSIQAPKNSKIRIDSDLYNVIGIRPPYLRVIECTADPAGSMKFITKTSFLGLNDNELQKIRFWMNSNMGLFQKKAAS